MNKIARSIIISAPRSKVWAAFADFGNVSRLSPGIVESHLTSEQTTGVGATRHCDLTMMGASLEERVVAWQENELLAIDIYEWKKMPMVKTMGAEFLLEDVDGGTKVTATMDYELGLGPIGALMNALMMRSMMSKGWGAFVAGVKHYIDTGRPVDDMAELPIDAVMPA